MSDFNGGLGEWGHAPGQDEMDGEIFGGDWQDFFGDRALVDDSDPVIVQATTGSSSPEATILPECYTPWQQESFVNSAVKSLPAGSTLSLQQNPEPALRLQLHDPSLTSSPLQPLLVSEKVSGPESVSLPKKAVNSNSILHPVWPPNSPGLAPGRGQGVHAPTDVVPGTMPPFPGSSLQSAEESYSRKRDRAKLLRRQMNEGYDNLYEALLEATTTCSIPLSSSAAALIPGRGPKRAVIVVRATEVVRALSAENAALRACLAASDRGPEFPAVSPVQVTPSAQGSPATVTQPIIPGPGLAPGMVAASAIAPGLRASLEADPPLALAPSLKRGPRICPGVASSPVLSNVLGTDPASAPTVPHDMVPASESGRDFTRARVCGSSPVGDRAGQGVKGQVFGQLLALAVFRFLGPQSLEEGRKVCRAWQDKCAWDCCWGNLCERRWRLSPEECMAEVWRLPNVVCPAPAPPSLRQVYHRLHADSRPPRGALSSLHTVIGRSHCKGSPMVWIALCRRSNGMTTRSVMGPVVGEYRAAEVVELRAVVQNLGERVSIRLPTHAFCVRHTSASREAEYSFPELPIQDPRSAPWLSLDDGAEVCERRGSGSDSRFACPQLGLFKYVSVDFLVEVRGCPTERAFLDMASAVDVNYVGVGEGERLRAGDAIRAGEMSGEMKGSERLITVALEEGEAGGAMSLEKEVEDRYGCVGLKGISPLRDD
ncbi:unnamed protein product [Choristocarpus tenellus]